MARIEKACNWSFYNISLNKEILCMFLMNGSEELPNVGCVYNVSLPAKHEIWTRSWIYLAPSPRTQMNKLYPSSFSVLKMNYVSLTVFLENDPFCITILTLNCWKLHFFSKHLHDPQNTSFPIPSVWTAAVYDYA